MSPDQTNTAEAVERLHGAIADRLNGLGNNERIFDSRTQLERYEMLAEVRVSDLEQALAELTRLHSRIMELEKALGPFKAAADDVDRDVHPALRCTDDMPIGDATYEVVTVGHCRAAARVLTEGVKHG